MQGVRGKPLLLPLPLNRRAVGWRLAVVMGRRASGAERSWVALSDDVNIGTPGVQALVLYCSETRD